MDDPIHNLVNSLSFLICSLRVCVCFLLQSKHMPQGQIGDAELSCRCTAPHSTMDWRKIRWPTLLKNKIKSHRETGIVGGNGISTLNGINIWVLCNITSDVTTIFVWHSSYKSASEIRLIRDWFQNHSNIYIWGPDTVLPLAMSSNS